MKYLGIDWGGKRIGLALADDETKIAMPFKVVGGVNEVLDIAKREGVNMIIIGEPIKMSGINDKLSEEFNNFIDLLKSKLTMPIKLVDERLSSKAADALPGEKKMKAERDAVAAMLILQGYLDRVGGDSNRE